MLQKSNVLESENEIKSKESKRLITNSRDNIDKLAKNMIIYFN